MAVKTKVKREKHTQKLFYTGVRNVLLGRENRKMNGKQQKDGNYSHKAKNDLKVSP